MDSLLCNACQVAIESDAARAAHYKSEWHRYNVKRRCAGLASIPQSLFESQLAALNQKKAAESAAKTSQQCAVCAKSFATASAYQAHLTTKKHIKKAESKKNGGAADDDEEGDDEKQAAKPARTAAVAAPAAPASASSGPAESKSDEDDETMESGEEEEEGEPIPLLQCLFCPSKREFKEMSACVDHMLKSHGFFIPFIENLTDLEGLLAYLGEKIGIGHVCLWCNGKGRARFPSTRAVQMHMEAKHHCKLRLEDEEDEEELLDFYDFDMEEEDDEDVAMDGSASSGAGKSSSSSSSTALVVKDDSAPRRSGGGGAAGINDAGELVLADGSIVGSRTHKHIYRQHLRPSRELVAITAEYKQLALATKADKKENPRIYRRAKEMHHVRLRKREDLAKGLAGNVQHHFRAQVMF